MTGTADILHYWFDEIGPDRWWTRSDTVDDEIRIRFGELWKEWRSRTPESFLGSAHEALAGIILFDQFSRNLHRGHADAFSTDSLALAVASGAIEHGLDREMDEDRRSFLYMPFMHSENLEDQRRSVVLFAALGNEKNLEYAREHHDMIKRFGRFPHRNAVLGRANRKGEEQAIEEGKDW